ncbi:hypothetical protein HDV00_005169 [Rhizophlyctis rosea]|nr:hypothetical protein HDV00_005169 [Rhizophlyctis rosea]
MSFVPAFLRGRSRARSPRPPEQPRSPPDTPAIVLTPPATPVPPTTAPATTSICTLCQRPYDPTARPHYTLPRRLIHIIKRLVVETGTLCPSCLESARDYTIFSHVWGQVSRFPAADLGVTGIHWTVPLRTRGKLGYLLGLAERWPPRFAWLDVVCMDQGPENEISPPQPELVFMHSYYKGAVVCIAALEDLPAGPFQRLADTAKLEAVEDADRVLRKEFFNVDVAVLTRSDTRQILMDMAAVVKAEWFSRVWTFQELGLPNNIEFYNMTGENINGHVLSRYGRIANSRRLKYQYQEVDLTNTIKSINELRDMRDAAIGVAKLKAADVMRLVEGRNSRDKQDRVFGAISLLPYAAQVNVHGVQTLDEAVRRLSKAALLAGDYSLVAFIGPAQQPLGDRWIPSLERGAKYQELGLTTSPSRAEASPSGLHVRGVIAKIEHFIPLSSTESQSLVHTLAETLSISEFDARQLVYNTLPLTPEPTSAADVFTQHAKMTEAALTAQVGNEKALVTARADGEELVVAVGTVGNEEEKPDQCVVLGNVKDYAGKMLAILTKRAREGEEGGGKERDVRVGYAFVVHTGLPVWDMSWEDATIA